MGMLGAAFLQGAGQGMNTLAAGMMRGVERQEEQTIWEKRAALLEQLRRDTAKVIREDEAEFADKRFPTLLSQTTQKIAATGKATEQAQTAADISRANNTELQAAIEAQAKRVQDLKLQLESDASKDPRTRAMVEQKLRDAEDEYKRLTPLAAARAAAVAGATAGATAAAANKNKKNPITEVIDAWEEATGVTMTPEMRKKVADAKSGLGKDDSQDKLIDTVMKEFVTTGELKPEDVGPTRARIVQSFTAARQDGDIGRAVQQARQDGKAAEAAEELRSKGFSDEQLAKWFTPAELKKAEKPKSSGILGSQEPTQSRTDKPTFDYVTAPDLSPPPRRQLLEKLEEQNRLTPMQAAELKALRGGR